MADFILCLFFIWAAVMVVGLVIALMPLILAVVGFFLMIGVFGLISAVVVNTFS